MKNLKSFQEYVNEARDLSNPDISYTEKFKSGDVETLIIELKKQKGAGFNRLANQYIDINEKIKDLTKKKNEINQKLQKNIDDITEDDDKYISRYIKSAALTMTLSKMSESIKETQDSKNIIDELLKYNDDYINSMLIPLIQQYTVIEKKVTKNRIASISNESLLNENIFNKIFGGLINLFKNLSKKIKWFDERIDEINKNIINLERGL